MVASLLLLLKIFLLVSNYTLDIQVLAFGVLASHVIIWSLQTTPPRPPSYHCLPCMFGTEQWEDILLIEQGQEPKQGNRNNDFFYLWPKCFVLSSRFSGTFLHLDMTLLSSISVLYF
jgi:hypothetical protein